MLEEAHERYRDTELCNGITWRYNVGCNVGLRGKVRRSKRNHLLRRSYSIIWEWSLVNLLDGEM